ncbi:MAG: hypothetical protein PHQ23_10040 [Candidatus Wallbacteria bacterium]|nr:hypothetical protein [Candidatus Wallbacteria bacterium]
MLTDEMKQEMLADAASQERRRAFEMLKNNRVIPIEDFLDFCTQWCSLFGCRRESRRIRTEKNIL